jgi:hypothetical protein
MRFLTSDVDRMRIDANGNIGIGTTSPLARLVVSNGSNEGIEFTAGSATVNGGVLQYINRSTLTTRPDMNYYLSSGGGAHKFYTNDAERMRIDAAGLVGIGTTSPSTVLDATQASSGYWTGSAWTGTPSAITITNTNLGGYDPVLIGRMTDSGGTIKNAFAIGAVGTSSWTAGNNASQTSDLYFAVRNNDGGISERMRINTLGNLGIGVASPLSRLDVREANRADSTNITNLGVYTTTAQSTGVGGTLALGGLFNSSDMAPYGSIRGGKQNSISGNYDGYLAFQTISNGGVLTEKMRIDSGGNVGIGIAAPAYRLDVRSGATATAGQFNSTATTAYNPSGYNGGAARLFMYGGNATGSFTGTQYTHGGNFEAFFGAVQNSSALADFVFQGFNGSVYAERMRITSAGLVGIGTSAPISGAGLTIGNDGNSSATVKQSFSTSTTERAFISMNASSGEMQYSAGYAGYGGFSTFYTADSERMRITSLGNVLFGTTTAVDGRLTIAADTGNSGAISTTNNGLTTYYPMLNYHGGTLRSYMAQTASGFTLISTGATTLVSTAEMAFNTNGAERARIDSGGNLLVGTTSATFGTSVGMRVFYTGSRMELGATDSTNDTVGYDMYSTGASAYRFFVGWGGTIYATSTSISAISDQRLKENVRDLDAGLDTILALKPRRFDWKEGKGKDVKDDMGFIAQEVEEVLPELIGDWKAGEGEPDDLKSVKAGDLIPVLVKAIQELTARVAQLEGN